MKKIIFCFCFMLFCFAKCIAQNDWELTGGYFPEGSSKEGVSFMTNNKGFIFIICDGDYSIEDCYTIYKSEDNGDSWTKLDENIKAIAIDNNDGLLAIKRENDKYFLCFSSDDGTTWKSCREQTKALNVGGYSIGNYNNLVIDNLGQFIFVLAVSGTGDTSYIKKFNNDLTYDESILLPFSLHLYGHGGNQSKTSVGITNQTSLYISTSNTYYGLTKKALYKSIDKGYTWKTVNTNTTDIIGAKYFLNDNEFYSLTNLLLKTTNGGISWSNILNKMNFPTPVYSGDGLNGFDVYKNNVSVGMSTYRKNNYSYEAQHLFRISYDGKNWNDFGKIDLPTGGYGTGILITKYGYCFAGIWGSNGLMLYRKMIPNFTKVEDKKTEVNVFSISPNPASDNISIFFSNSDFSNKSISIFNSLGIEIKRFNSAELSEKSSINITTHEFPSGIYYCSMNLGTNRITKSFVIIR